MRLVLLLILLKALLLASSASGDVLRVPGSVPDVHDGDTFTFKTTLRVSIVGASVNSRRVKDETITFTIQVRLVDSSNPSLKRGVWSPELTEEGGDRAKNNLERMVLGKRCTLLIDLDQVFTSIGPGKNLANVSRLLTLNRILGDAEVPPFKTTLGRRQVIAGHAYWTKELLDEALR